MSVKEDKRLRDLEEYINFLKDVLRETGKITNLDELWEDWKKQVGFFRPKKLK